MHEISSTLFFSRHFIFEGLSSNWINTFFVGRHFFGGGGLSQIKVVLHSGKYGTSLYIMKVTKLFVSFIAIISLTTHFTAVHLHEMFAPIDSNL